jgi:head-tail adaptor
MALIAAGKRDRKIAFYPRTLGQDALGVETESDGTAVLAWANVRFGTGAERRDLAQAGSMQTATFRVLSTASLRTVTERWQIQFLGARWGIVSIAQLGEADEIEFTATKKGA